VNHYLSYGGGVNGFRELRTRPIEAPEAPPRPSCTHCGAFLRAGNPGPLCTPCGRSPLDLPAWALELATETAGVQLSTVATILRAERGITAPTDVPEPDAPLCACGCGEQVLRAVLSRHGNLSRTGPWLRTLQGHQVFGRQHRRREG
jgi:hypothetical protein